MNIEHYYYYYTAQMTVNIVCLLPLNDQIPVCLIETGKIHTLISSAPTNRSDEYTTL